jgi:hypothetical protein
MTIVSMNNRILRYAPGINPLIAKSCLQDADAQLCDMDWNRLNTWSQVPTVAPYGTGTVLVSSGGVVTLTGGVFTAAMVGRQMRLASFADSYFQIATVTPPSSLTLTNWIGETISSAITYNIFQVLYTTAVPLKLIYDVVFQTNLVKKSQTYFNKIDPSRITTSSTPMWWAYAGVGANDAIVIEIYPVPAQVVGLRIYGKVRASTLADTDVPLLPEDLIEARALIDCYAILDRMQPKMGWDVKGEKQMTINYPETLERARNEDFELGWHPDKVKDRFTETDFPEDDNFALSHDVG